MNLKGLAWALLLAGLAFAMIGHVIWANSRLHPDQMVYLLQFPIIPGYTAIMMGWCGILAEKIYTGFDRKDISLPTN